MRELDSLATRPAGASAPPARPTEAGARLHDTGAAWLTPSYGLRPIAARLPGPLQADVSRAQQALDYLGELAASLLALKDELSARLGKAETDPAQLHRRLNRVAAVLERREQEAGQSLDHALQFQPSARQLFTLPGLDGAYADAQEQIELVLPGAGRIEVAAVPGIPQEMLVKDLAARMAPVGIRLESMAPARWSVDGAAWPPLRDKLRVGGLGPSSLDFPPVEMPRIDSEQPTGLRAALQAVLRMLAQVQHAQDSARSALQDAGQLVRPTATLPAPAPLAEQLQANDYQSMLYVTAAMAGISRERVLALLGLRPHAL